LLLPPARDNDLRDLYNPDQPNHMQLASSPAGRKVYYADPYKVPDGAPTVGTIRDKDLFVNELTSAIVTFTEEQRWQYIRLVEVNESDEVLGFKAIVATHRYASIPYTTGFEQGDIDPEFWTITKENDSGRINVTSEHAPNSGNYHLILDASETGNYGTNSADLHLKLSDNYKDIILKISLKTFGNEVHPEDRIYFSDDAGVNFTKVYDFETTPNYKNLSLNISELSDSAGLSLSEEFIIRFQNKNNAPATQDGMAIDDISVDDSAIKSGSVEFLELDNNTQGEWMWHYGVDGHFIAGKETVLPDYADLSWNPNSKTVVWEDNSSDVRGLQYDENATVLSARYAESENHPWWFIVDAGETEKSVSIYFLDADNQNRRVILNIIDKSTGELYDTHTIQNFANGRWYTWKITGKVRFVLDVQRGTSAVVSGIFFNPSAPADIKVGNFLSFDGVDDFIDCGRDESLQISGPEITLEAWFKINNTKPATWQSTILAMDHSETNNDLGYFVRANGNGQIEWGFGDGDWHEIKSKDGAQLFEMGTWNHVAGVYDGVFQKIYLNGNLITKSDSFNTTVGAVPSENLFLGSTPSFSDRVTDASLAEVRIWNIARSNSEIKEFATQRITGSESGLAAYWPIDEGEGQTIEDISSNDNSGLLGGRLKKIVLILYGQKKPLFRFR